MIRELIIIVVGTTAFCLLFHLPKRHLPLALFGTALCWGLYRLLYARIDNLLCAVLVVSMFSAAYAELVAKHVRAPATLFLIPTLIPLVPGNSVYLMMLGLVRGDREAMELYGTLTAQWAVGLAAGISLVAVVHQILHQPKPKRRRARPRLCLSYHRSGKKKRKNTNACSPVWAARISDGQKPRRVSPRTAK